jgi:tetratricopeptide (TPR) repeat protein
MATRVRQAFALAEESGDPMLYVAISLGAYALFCVGAYREGLAICDRAIERAQGDPRAGADVIGGSPYAWCRAQRGGFLTVLGEFEEAHREIEEGRRIAGEQGEIETVGFIHHFSIVLAYHRGEPEEALARAQQALEIAERTGSSFSRAWSWYFLGWAEMMRGEWRPAIAAIERSAAIANEHRTAREATGLRMASLGEAYLGLGDLERARTLVDEGFAIAHEQGNQVGMTYASLARARVLLGSAGPAARTEIEAALARALELEHGVGGKAYVPMVHVELAELARQCGDPEGHERELREAHRLFTELGATGHTERLASELALPAR